jgi:hypothetical protein
MELYCPNEFRRDTPQGIVGEWRNLYEGVKQPNVENIRVPILKLAHVTHNAEAHQITTDHSYQFKVAPKYGRPGTGSFWWRPDKKKFVPIDENTNLFQGNYSWWGPYCAHDYHLPEGHTNEEYCISPAEINKRIRPQRHYFVANYLKHPSESIYGNCVFYADFLDLLDAYAESRNSKEVFIKIGGTLRYRSEICFVLIVCTEHENDDLDFPALRTNDEYFETNGLINDDGRVIDRNAIANFHPRHIIQWAKPREDGGKPSYSYITPAFAFYYPDEGELLELQLAKCHKAEVIHKEGFCLKAVNKKKCPNNPSQPDGSNSSQSDSDSNNSYQSDSDS